MGEEVAKHNVRRGGEEEDEKVDSGRMEEEMESRLGGSLGHGKELRGSPTAKAKAKLTGRSKSDQGAKVTVLDAAFVAVTPSRAKHNALAACLLEGE